MTYFKVPKRAKGQLLVGEDKRNPFVEISSLLDLGGGINSYAKTCHGGFIATIVDEVMGTAAWQQSGGMSQLSSAQLLEDMHTDYVLS